MWNIIVGFIGTILISGLGYYYFNKNRYNDEVVELLNVVFDGVKCIKYQYRGQKYIYLTELMDEDIVKIQSEIDPANTFKDTLPEIDYKYIILRLKEKNTGQEHEIILDEMNFLYALVGPANTYYFAFDTRFNEKLTKFMNYLFETEEGSLTYGRMSALLNPEKYFKLKSRITDIKQSGDYELEWKIA
jgi:hypothetical protein